MFVHCLLSETHGYQGLKVAFHQPGSDFIVLIEARDFYSRIYGSLSLAVLMYMFTMTDWQ